MQTQSLHNSGGLFLQLSRHRCKCVRRKKLPRSLKLPDLGETFAYLVLIDSLSVPVPGKNFGSYLIRRAFFIHPDNVVSNVVNNVYRAGENIKNDVQISHSVLVYHLNRSFSGLNGESFRVFAVSRIKNRLPRLCASPYSGNCVSSSCPFRFRTSGLRCRSWSCTRTGRRSGIRRIRRSLRSRRDCGCSGL